MFRVAIIEDEPKMAQALSACVKSIVPDAIIVFQVDSIVSAVEKIETHKLDLVFFDVELKDGLSFEIFDKLSGIDFQLVFVTAHSHYAVNAFEFSAVDYIVKPVCVESVERAIIRAKQNMQEKIGVNNINMLLENLNSENRDQKIILQTTDTTHYVAMKDILRCESENNYCSFVLLCGDKILVSKSLKEYEKILPGSCFFRAHQSHLININYIKQIKKRTYKVILSNGDKIPLASRRKDELLALMKQRVSN